MFKALKALLDTSNTKEKFTLDLQVTLGVGKTKVEDSVPEFFDGEIFSDDENDEWTSSSDFNNPELLTRVNTD